MSVRIRLKRAGSKHRPFYKIVVADSRSPRDGRAIEALGHYDPVKMPEVLEVNEDRLNYWLSKGAITSDSVEALLRRMRRRLKRGEAFEAEEIIESAPSIEEPKDLADEKEAKDAGEADGEGSGGESAEAAESEAGETDAAPEGERVKE